MVEVSCLDVQFTAATKAEVLEATQARIATLNPEIVLAASQNPKLAEAIARMSHCTIDGTGLWYALRYRYHQPFEHYAGANLVEDLAKSGRSMFLLGGEAGVAAEAGKALAERFGAKVVGSASGGQIDPENPLVPKLVAEIIALKPDILLVGFGAPKQELWIDAARDLPIPVMVGVGGSFDFYVKKKRAPQYLRALHLEWLWRGMSEPGHWKRVWRAVVVFPLRALFGSRN